VLIFHPSFKVSNKILHSPLVITSTSDCPVSIFLYQNLAKLCDFKHKNLDTNITILLLCSLDIFKHIKIIAFSLKYSGSWKEHDISVQIWTSNANEKFDSKIQRHSWNISKSHMELLFWPDPACHVLTYH